MLAWHIACRFKLEKTRAPAGSLCLKTSLPWVAFESSAAAAAPASTSSEGEGGAGVGMSGSGGAAGGAVGASGTTLVPPVGVIMPGGKGRERQGGTAVREALMNCRFFLY